MGCDRFSALHASRTDGVLRLFYDKRFTLNFLKPSYCMSPQCITRNSSGITILIRLTDAWDARGAQLQNLQMSPRTDWGTAVPPPLNCRPRPVSTPWWLGFFFCSSPKCYTYIAERLCFRRFLVETLPSDKYCTLDPFVPLFSERSGRAHSENTNHNVRLSHTYRSCRE